MKLIDKITLKYEDDIMYILETSRKVGGEFHLNLRDQTRFTTALSEICRNSFQYAGEAIVTFYLKNKDNKQYLIVEVIDEGSGFIDSKGDLLIGKEKNKNRGKGISSSRKLVDFLTIKPGDEKGTVVKLGILIKGINGEQITKQEINQAKDRLNQKKSTSPLQDVKEQNEALLKAYEEIKKKENQLEKANQQQQRLIRKMEEKNQELKDFARVVSHDLKNPLSGIKGLAEILNKKYKQNMDQRGGEIVEMIISATNKMNMLINGILKYSQANVDDEDTIKKLKTNEIVNDTIELLNPEENVDIRIEKLPVVYYNKTELHQVFQNLISNAIKYNNKEQVEIKISYQKENGNYVFSITDNGPGIREEDREKVFGLFKTLGTKSNSDSGTGIGLSLVKKIVKKNDGEIWIDSEVGKSTTFFFTIPKGKRNQ